MFKTYDDVISFNKANVEAAVAAGTKFAAGIEEVAKEYFGFVGKSVETAIEQAKTAAATKNVADALKLQQDFLKSSYEGLVAEATKIGKLSQVVATSAAEPLKARAKAAYEVFSRAA